MGGGGQVLELVKTVKDGILSGGSVITVGVLGEILDLGKMIAELDIIEVSSVFICPISLELMQDHVTLCTGQTYEREGFWGRNFLKFESIGGVTENSERSLVVSIDAVPQFIEMLPDLNAETLELALYILEVLLTVPKGSLALKECPSTILTIVKLSMKISGNCTQLALSILWAIFELAPEECAALAVDAGLSAKLLLVIQSGCNPLLKQQSAELLKLCRLHRYNVQFQL
ncbi:hypothetical protein AgCh_007042 [Apium graveolens]